MPPDGATLQDLQQIHATAAEKPGKEFTTMAETVHQEPTTPAAEQ